MPMPRVTSGTAPSATVFNTLADEIDSLGAGCQVRRTTAYTGMQNATDLIVPWQAVTYDTIGGMWSPATPNYVRVTVAGVYSVTLQERFAAVTTGSPYTAGQRAGKIMLNGSSVFANSQASDKRGADVVAEGVTLSMTAVLRLNVDDLIYANFWQSSGGTITALQVDYGGTFLSLNRMGPLVA